VVLKIRQDTGQEDGCNYEGVRFLVFSMLLEDCYGRHTIADAFASVVRFEDAAIYWIAVTMAEYTEDAIKQPWVERYINRLIENPLLNTATSPAIVDRKVPDKNDLDRTITSIVFLGEKEDLPEYLKSVQWPPLRERLETAGSFAFWGYQKLALKYHPWLCHTVKFTDKAPKMLKLMCPTVSRTKSARN